MTEPASPQIRVTGNNTTRLWGLSPLTDQQIGGAAMALEESLLLFAVGAWYFLRFLSGEGRADAYRALDPSSYNQTGR